MRKLALVFSVAALLGVVCPPSAWSYVPPSQYIVKTVADKHTGIAGVRVRSRVSAFSGQTAMPQGPRFQVTTVYSASSQLIRCSVEDEKGQVLYWHERRIEPQSDPAVVPVALLFGSNASVLTEILLKHKVPVRTESELQSLSDEEQRRSAEKLSLSRWKHSISWVIGASDSAPSIWVEKDIFLPTRLLLSSEIQFENYRFYKEFPYPRTITLVRDGAAELREELIDLLVDPAPELAGLKKSVRLGWTEAGDQVSGDVRDLIEKYFSRMR